MLPDRFIDRGEKADHSVLSYRKCASVPVSMTKRMPITVYRLKVFIKIPPRLVYVTLRQICAAQIPDISCRNAHVADWRFRRSDVLGSVKAYGTANCKPCVFFASKKREYHLLHMEIHLLRR